MKALDTMKKIEKLSETSESLAIVLYAFAEKKCVFCSHKGDCADSKKRTMMSSHEAAGAAVSPRFCPDWDFDIPLSVMTIDLMTKKIPELQESVYDYPLDAK